MARVMTTEQGLGWERVGQRTFHLPSVVELFLEEYPIFDVDT